MYIWPFYISNFIACFIPKRSRRHRVRGLINTFLYRLPVSIFIRRVYGEKMKTCRFVRQNTLNRMICVVNDKYYVKIFRNVSVKQLNNYKFLLDFIRPNLKVEIPEIVVAKHIPMYVSKKLSGKDMREFDRDLIKQNGERIKTQVFEIIHSIQQIPFDSIPGKERFIFGIQPERTVEKEYEEGHSVLAHFDLNTGNLLLDDKLNIISVIDWDSLSLAHNPNTDKDIFLKYWNKRFNKKPLK